MNSPVKSSRGHRIPPLAGLQAFAATARLLSFRQAAEELNVTKSAVSHQVQALEDHLGVRLLNRNTREVSLTEVGQQFLPDVEAALEQLAAAAERLKPKSGNTPLTITMLPTFGVRWLIPRLGDFHQRYPDIEVRLDTSLEIVEFKHSDVDMAIRYGRGDWPNVECEPLIEESLVPVCSPALLKNGPPLEKPSDLANHTLLQNSAHRDDWPIWLTAAGVSDIDWQHGPSFAYSELLLRAAAEGMGVALARRHLVESELAAGTLVAPLEFSYARGYLYWLVYPENALSDPRVSAFREWLLNQVRPDTD